LQFLADCTRQAFNFENQTKNYTISTTTSTPTWKIMSTVRRSAIIRMMPISRAPVLLRSRNHLLLKLLVQSSQVWILDKKTTLPKKKNFKNKKHRENLDVMMKKLWETKKQYH
jgi:hypothetical protein